ncbi:hypothetical protein MMC25_003360 [Agyrium rufum]|nr:hypothetical protein [Agyrium rufum]
MPGESPNGENVNKLRDEERCIPFASPEDGNFSELKREGKIGHSRTNRRPSNDAGLREPNGRLQSEDTRDEKLCCKVKSYGKWENTGVLEASQADALQALANGSPVQIETVEETDTPRLPSPPDDTIGTILEEKSGEKRHATEEIGTKENECTVRIDKPVLKLTPEQLFELTSSPRVVSIPTPKSELSSDVESNKETDRRYGREHRSTIEGTRAADWRDHSQVRHSRERSGTIPNSPKFRTEEASFSERPNLSQRTASTPILRRSQASSKAVPNANGQASQKSGQKLIATPLDLDVLSSRLKISQREKLAESPMLDALPMPPLSVPTFLQLELSSKAPSSLYIHRPSGRDQPYESSQVKIERLMNFLLLPPHLEMILWFGTFACIDAWLYTFTILPLRFLKACLILMSSWGRNLVAEIRFIASFVYSGLGRIWRRNRTQKDNGLPSNTEKDRPVPSRNISTTQARTHSSSVQPDYRFPNSAEKKGAGASVEDSQKRHEGQRRRHRRARSEPSKLLPGHKADILRGLLILVTCVLLMYLDASMMYHSIRGQAAIKLYVIYNVLEVFDRLLAAFGQDVLECLFATETLERGLDGRSKILRPFWLFLLALLYNVVHSAALFYQVMTLNVAVNSYSNALLTLLMSNQFVEIKGTVFKKFEKDSLFQLTCADIVERFQLWLMLMIIVARNVIETSGLGDSSMGGGSGPPTKSSTILPHSFTVLPSWTGEILSPFFMVLGTEMLVDWVKHAYITKFNNTKPNIYGRFLDVLAKDYYSDAFSDPNLTRRFGLSTIPLSCLFIRASIQTYHMFLATHVPTPLPSVATSLSVETATSTSPATTAALQHIDNIVRNALGRSSIATKTILWPSTWLKLTTNDLIALSTKILFFLLLYLVLLCIKLFLGMTLLSIARSRYERMRAKDKQRMTTSTSTEGARRFGGWGVTEVDDPKRKWIYDDDGEGLKKAREREKKATAEAENKGGREAQEKAMKEQQSLERVHRFSMVAKRIW